MVKVEIVYEGKDFSSLKVKGHADSAPYGQDVVCGAVSVVCFGALNALSNIDEDFEYEVDDKGGYIYLHAKGKVSDHDQIVLETLILQLKTIEVSYGTSITIKERK